MSKFDKLIKRIRNLSSDLRYEELEKILIEYGYVVDQPKSGSSHYTFRKKGHTPITIKKDSKMKKFYVKMIKQVVEEEE
ncbi:MAG: toxin HicA [Clostridia bacterium]|nr:toxin HicA [Clostridia bacterium]